MLKSVVWNSQDKSRYFFSLAQQPATADPCFTRRDRWDRPNLDITHLRSIYSMQQSPSWEANRFSVGQEIPRILWNPKVHCRFHKFPPPVHILNQVDPAHTPTSHILNISMYQNLISLFGCLGRTRVSGQVWCLFCERLVTGYVITVRSC
jgi:hypothetical protein